MLKSVKFKKTDLSENKQGALAGVAQWTEGRPVKQRAMGSIPSQGTCLGCRPGFLVKGVQEATIHWCFSPSVSLSLFVCLKINKYNLLKKEKEKENKVAKKKRSK